MAVVHLEAPVLDPAVTVDVEGLNAEPGHLVLGFALVVGQQLGLQHEVAHVDEGRTARSRGDHTGPSNPHRPPTTKTTASPTPSQESNAADKEAFA